MKEGFANKFVKSSGLSSSIYYPLHTTHYILLVFLLLSIYYILPTSAEAISISPLTYEVNADPGQVIEQTVMIFNNESAEVPITMLTEDFSPVGESGNVIIEPLPKEISASGWVSFVPNAFALKPGSSQSVKYILKIPENAEPGGHYTAIIASTGLPSDLGGSGTSLAQKVASLILIKVSGPVSEKLTIKEFLAPKFLEFPPVNFEARFENTGTVHLKPAGFVTIKDMFGNEVDKLDLPQSRVLPHTTRLINISWKPTGYHMGKYRVELSAIYGGSNERLDAATEFWILPWKQLSGTGAGIIIIGAFSWRIRKRLKLALRILFRGN